MSDGLKLYELTETYRQAVALLEEGATDDGETFDILREALTRIEGQIADKLDSCACLRAEWLRTEEALKAEAARLTKRARVLANRAENLREYMRLEMVGADLKKVEGERFKLGRRLGPPSVKDCDEGQALLAGIPGTATLPAEVAREAGLLDKATDLSAERKPIIEAWKNDPDSVPYARVEQKEYLAIS